MSADDHEESISRDLPAGLTEDDIRRFRTKFEAEARSQRAAYARARHNGSLPTRDDLDRDNRAQRRIDQVMDRRDHE